MCPGQRPSPTPSRESNPIESIETSSELDVVSKTTPYRPVSRGYTTEHAFAASYTPSAVDHSSSLDSPTANALPPSASTSTLSTPPSTSSSPSSSPSPSPLSTPASSPLRPATPSPSNASPAFLTSPHAINRAIHCKLHEILAPNDGKGYIYILRDPAQPEKGYKIGITKQGNHVARIKQHWRSCGFVRDVVWVTGEIAYRKRTEDLIHLDLAEQRRILECEGHKGKNVSPSVTRHREWFDIKEDEAMRTVKKWEKFMNDEEPYDIWRQLNPIWKFLFAKRHIAQPFTSTVANHDTRREQWTQVLSSPTRLDQLKFKVELLRGYWRSLVDQIVYIWPYCEAFCWQAVALLYGFMFILMLRNTFAATAFAALLMCAWSSIKAQLKIELQKSVRSKSS